MNESTAADTDTAGADPMNEFEMLKSRARMMGIEFSNNIKIDTLRARIDAKLDGVEDPAAADEVAADAASGLNPLAMGAASISTLPGAPAVAEGVVAPKMTFREEIIAENTRLVRVRITNLDPKKKDLPGEVITVANEYMGTISKYVPFGEVTDDGYHIPYCIFMMLDARKFLDIRTSRDPKTGSPKVTTRWAREFSIDLLDPLTQEQLDQLAQAQLAAGSIENADLAI